MAFLAVEGVEVQTPSAMSVGIQDVSAPDSGRDITGLMHKNTITQKRTIALEWRNISPEEMQTLVNIFSAREYFRVTYNDPTNASQRITKTFYLGDRTAPIYNWAMRIYESLTFNIIER